jgi:hypothetical protein
MAPSFTSPARRPGVQPSSTPGYGHVAFRYFSTASAERPARATALARRSRLTPNFMVQYSISSSSSKLRNSLSCGARFVLSSAMAIFLVVPSDNSTPLDLVPAGISSCRPPLTTPVRKKRLWPDLPRMSFSTISTSRGSCEPSARRSASCWSRPATPRPESIHPLNGPLSYEERQRARARSKCSTRGTARSTFHKYRGRSRRFGQHRYFEM